MTNIGHYSLILSIILFLGSCNSSEKDHITGNYEEIPITSYVVMYCPLKEIFLYAGENYTIRIYDKISDKFYSQFKEKNNSPQDYERYLELREYFGDIGYEGIIVPEALGRYPQQFLEDIFTKVEIISNKDFNESHPAQSSLADICMFYTISPFEYIKSAYTGFSWEEYEYKSEFKPLFRYVLSNTHIPDGDHLYYYPIRKIVEQLTEAELSLLGRGYSNNQHFEGSPCAVIRFIEQPSESEPHLITITLTNSEGKEFSDTVEVIFE